jgi:hypothetical protein
VETNPPRNSQRETHRSDGLWNWSGVGRTARSSSTGPSSPVFQPHGQAKLPGAAVRAEERAEGAELKPAQVQLGRELVGGEKSARVCAPVRNATEPGVQGVGDLGPQRRPLRVGVTDRRTP